MRQQLKRMAMTLAISGVLVGGGSAIAHAADASPSAKASSSAAVEFGFVELGASSERGGLGQMSERVANRTRKGAAPDVPGAAPCLMWNETLCARD